MKVKKTKSGKFNLTLSHGERDELWTSIISYLEDESLKLIGNPLRSEEDINRSLHYSVINTLLIKNFFLQQNTVEKLTLTRTEAIALMWLIRGNTDMISRNLKSDLHKLLLL